MSKVLGIVLAGVFATGLAAAQSYPAASGSAAGSVVGGTKNSYPTHPAVEHGAQPAGQAGYGTTNNYPTHPAVQHDAHAGAGAQYAAKDDKDKDRAKDKACPPGLDKKNNGCMPPGHARAQDTHAMGNAAAPHERQREHARDRDRDRDHDRAGRDRDDDKRGRSSRSGHHDD